MRPTRKPWRPASLVRRLASYCRFRSTRNGIGRSTSGISSISYLFVWILMLKKKSASMRRNLRPWSDSFALSPMRRSRSLLCKA